MLKQVVGKTVEVNIVGVGGEVDTGPVSIPFVEGEAEVCEAGAEYPGPDSAGAVEFSPGEDGEGVGP